MVRWRIFCSLLAVSVLAVPVKGQSGVPAEEGTGSACGAAPPLTANAEQAAEEIGVMPLVQRLRALSSACDRSGVITIEELALRQQITDAVVVANTAPATDPRIHVSWREELIAE